MEPLCRRCLLKDMTDSAYFQSIYDYIQALPPELKTPEPEYQRRLVLCSRCDELVNGMCRLCGCFVEVRAAKSHNSCSKTQAAW